MRIHRHDTDRPINNTHAPSNIRHYSELFAIHTSQRRSCSLDEPLGV